MTQRIHDFWRRLSAGLTVQELWGQFHREARSSMAVYTADTAMKEATSGTSGFSLVRAVIRAMLDKLSPPRRVLLFIALVALLFPAVVGDSGRFSLQFPGAFIAAVIAIALLVLELADRVAMKRDLEIARDIQKLLLPDAPPQVAGIEIAFATRPANTVAGDYYDAFVRSAAGASDRLFLLVADVAGKGIPAGMLMATLQANVRAFAEEDVTLVEMVSRLNRCSCARSGGGRRFTTAFFAELDLSSNLLSYVNAGHNAPIIMRANSTMEYLDVGGLPLGVFTSSSYQSGSTTLHSGDTVYIYTDGVVEAVNSAGEEYGEQRLESLLRQQTDLPAPEKLSSLIASVNYFAGTAAQYDDMTCLVLRVTAAAHGVRDAQAAGVVHA